MNTSTSNFNSQSQYQSNVQESNPAVVYICGSKFLSKLIFTF